MDIMSLMHYQQQANLQNSRQQLAEKEAEAKRKIEEEEARLDVCKKKIEIAKSIGGKKGDALIDEIIKDYFPEYSNCTEEAIELIENKPKT